MQKEAGGQLKINTLVIRLFEKERNAPEEIFLF